MKVTQIYNVVNQVCNDILGRPTYLGSDGNVYTSNQNLPQGVTVGDPSWLLREDLTNIVDIGRLVLDSGSADNYEGIFKSLINHIGRVIVVNRQYTPIVPSVMKDGWEYGSILEKIDADMPESISNPKWYPQNGVIYQQDKFTNLQNIRVKFFNEAVTYQIEMSYTTDQLKQSFSNLMQLNAFMSMIEVKIRNKMAIDYANLIRGTINNFTSATIYKDFHSMLDNGTHRYNFGNNSFVRSVNLLGKYHEEGYDTQNLLTPQNCLKDLDFLKYAAYNLKLYSDRLADISTLFNIGGRERFTNKENQHIVLLSEFKSAADVYLQSDTFHNELTKMPEAETINFWQGTGNDYSFSNTSKIHTVSRVTADGVTFTNVETEVTGIIGIIFDNDALGVNNERSIVTTHYNANGDFVNNYYKSFARYFNDYDENFVVFFVA